MKYRFGTAALAGLAALAPAAALAQRGWFFECIDPENTTPYSDDYGINVLENDLAGVAMGVSGSVEYGGGDLDPCYGDSARTEDAAGRLCFYAGQTGSVQSSFDDFLAYTYGAPFDPVGDFCFARILKTADNATASSVLFGDGGVTNYFLGASKRYMQAQWADADVEVVLNVRLIGDASRLRWRMRNLSADALPLGLLFCTYTGMKTTGQVDSETGADVALTLRTGLTGIPKRTPDGYLGIVNLPTGKPVKTERKYLSSSPNFPDWVDFAFGQTNYYGIRIENTPSEAFVDASTADEIVIADHILPGEGSTSGQEFLFNNSARQSVFGDPTGLLEEADVAITEYAFLQRFPATSVASGGTRDIVHYVRSTWSNGDYRDPYTTVVDAPKLIGVDPAGLNGHSNNPFPVRVYVDNQFADIDKDVALSNTKIRIELGSGLSLASGQPDQVIIPTIAPNAINSATFTVVADAQTFGDIPYKIYVTPNPGPARVISGIIRVGATPRITKPAGPNMVGLPFTFTDNSLNAILGLQAGIDYQAYRWEPLSQEYVPVVTPVRGQGYWLVLDAAIAQNLNGASIAEDIGTGGVLTTLKRGWNLISNPYNYPIKLAELNFVVTGGTEGGVITFVEAVTQGVISGGLAYYSNGTYEFLNDSGELLEPTKAYWIYSDSFDDITLSWPPVFTPGLPNSGRSTTPFEQSDRQWRLQLSARSNDGIDSQNFVGAASDPKASAKLGILEPPAAPGAPFTMSVKAQHKGQETRMAQAITPRTGKMDWKVEVKAEKEGDVTITWPNLASLPKSLRFRIKDDASGTVRDLRTTSGYTFRAAAAGTRTFTISAEVGGATRALIGSVAVGRGSRDANGPVTINYALTGDANVSVRILSNTGKEVYTVTRGRADSAGENTVTWLLRDNANRAVAPGVYRAEIIAESASGERVRKFVPINIVR